MVAGEVGEHAAGEVQAGYAALGAGMAAHLHGGEGAAGVDHLGQQGVEFERVGGGVGGGHGAVVDAVDHGAEQAGALAAHAGHVVEQGGDGGLAVGAGDAYERKAARGVAVPCRGEAAEGFGRAAGGAHECSVARGGAFGQRVGGVAHYGCGAGCDGCRDEAVAVDGGAGHGHEDAAGRNAARVGGDAAYAHVGRAVDAARPYIAE